MARTETALFAFNRGLVSRLGLARVDIKRIALSAEVMTNWMPRVLGSMMLRPGMGHVGSTLNNSRARNLPFVFSTTDTAILEFSSGAMRVWVNDALVTRASVATTVTNGTFATNLTGWTQNDEVGGTSSWASPNYMQLVGSGTAAAIRDQGVSVSVADAGKEHALRITVVRGPVTLRVGYSLGDDSLITETILQTGTHSLAFTPTTTFYIRFLSRQEPLVWISNCTIESAGVMQLPAPWLDADIDYIRADQSADVIFVACRNFQQRRIERRSTTSWSVVLYLPPDGPFNVQNTGTITLTPSGLNGNIGITASEPIFRATHVGALFSITSIGQIVDVGITAQNTFTNSIKVTGIGGVRNFSVFISGTFVATITLQSSITSSTGPWSDVAGESWSASVSASFNDGLDNQIIWYRIGCKTGDYTSGTAACTLNLATGSITGIVRITKYNGASAADVEVLKALGGLTASSDWAEGRWSDYRGWPSAVALFDGRLWWSGKSSIWASVSDAYDSFDATIVGDSGPIDRSIGSGPVDSIHWILPLQRLIVGSAGGEHSCRSDSLDIPLTPTNFGIRKASTQGSANVAPILVDLTGIYVQRGGYRVFHLQFNNNYLNYEYGSENLSELVPEIGKPGITRIAVQRQPDTRIHCVRSDGTAVVLIMDKTENVNCWVDVTTDGLIEDVVVLPAGVGQQDDLVYYVVNRTINGSTVRYLEKWAQEEECKGDQQLCRLADSFVVYSGIPTLTITGLSHLEGKTVVVWADGSDVGTNDSVSPWVQKYTVSGGQITLASLASNVVVGLPYTAQFKSAKLDVQLDGSTSLTLVKKINSIGLILADVHAKGLQYGPDFSSLDDMPEIEEGEILGNVTESDYAHKEINFPGYWTTDTRVCLQAQAPRPCTALAATMSIEVGG